MSGELVEAASHPHLKAQKKNPASRPKIATPHKKHKIGKQLLVTAAERESDGPDSLHDQTHDRRVEAGAYFGQCAKKYSVFRHGVIDARSAHDAGSHRAKARGSDQQGQPASCAG